MYVVVGLSVSCVAIQGFITVRNNLWDWQSLQVYSGPGTQFYEFCDALEVKDRMASGPEGWGLEHALRAWGAYFSVSRSICTCHIHPLTLFCRARLWRNVGSTEGH